MQHKERRASSEPRQWLMTDITKLPLLRFLIAIASLAISVWAAGGSMLLSYLLLGRRITPGAVEAKTWQLLGETGWPAFMVIMHWGSAIVMAVVPVLCIVQGRKLAENCGYARSLGTTLIVLGVVVFIGGVLATPPIIRRVGFPYIPSW
jgi:hypothetical protein